ncbi:hypothetical protein [Pararhizobium sp. DWP1-1-3]|uniref:hypothetical protein n=1 Tax=Pararhizobium sp. DWP1-1-3 TaxID=2804652 RepID=UPI003CF7E055
MDRLLTSVLDAHGGLQNWAKVTKLTADMTLGGPFWGARGWQGIFDRQTVIADPHREHITFSPFTAERYTSVLDVAPERVALTTSDGRTIQERLNPRESFPTAFDPFTTPWDAIQVAYFASAAVWNYLTAPFVFVQSGVIATEIDPWTEDGQIWRRLAVSFPTSIANHNADQTFYYDQSYLLRRMDYSPDVTGKPPVAHYAFDHKTFDGFVFPTRRRVFLHDADGIADKGFAPITIDLAYVKVERR